MTVVLEASGLVRHYSVGMRWAQRTVRALDGVSITLAAGRTLGVVGESGCGKSTLARLVTLVEPPLAGSLRIDGIEVKGARKSALARLRPRVQMVFQNPYASLNPRKTVAEMLDEPLALNTALARATRRERVRDMLVAVGLNSEHARRYPHMFSGGQRQRIAIARAMILEPKVLVADEPVSALDVSVQAQILNLFMDLQDARGTAFVFISHNLSVIEHLAHEVAVMYLGRIVEEGPKQRIFGAPLHPYTQVLLAASPGRALMGNRPGKTIAIVGEPASALAPPSGCAFHPRCLSATERCRIEAPVLENRDGRRVACHQPRPL